ncbi:uncharacterized protein LOC135836542 isoform X2 [Planococcus citri]|uniref:uncharacterized protein LOC135836542 isoform X2 n=1 Tax=Planococcus citri TaxID=170843 RepID=UPI0031F74FB3
MDENMDEVKLWGEYEGSSNSSKLQCNRDASNNTEHEVILNSIKNINPKRYFFNPDRQSRFIPIKKETKYIRLDNTMKDIIKMMNYRDEMKTIVEKAAIRDVDQLNEQIRTLPVPKLLKEKHDSCSRPRLQIQTDSNFVNGIWDEKPPSLTPESALNTLSTSVATVLAFTGFTDTSNLSLNVLTEITEEYIKKMLRLLKFNVEKEKLRGESGFCDVVDRTFHEIGLGSLRNLITYYQSSIIDYKNKKLKEVKDEILACDNVIEKMKEEQRQVNGRSIILEEENSGIPELHVTSMLGNDLLSSSFETGLQMLHTIENQKLTDVESDSLNDSKGQLQNEYTDSKAVKRKRR